MKKAPKAQALQRKDPDDLAQAGIDTFITLNGGLEKLIETLLLANTDPSVDALTTLLLDPAFAGDAYTGANPVNIRKLCKQAGLTVADFFRAYQKANTVKAQLDASVIAREGTAAVVRDIFRRAAPYQVPCQHCQGTGSLTPEPSRTTPNPQPVPCKPCKGIGTIEQLPDLDRQKLALEISEIVKRSGISLQNNTQINNQAPAASNSYLEDVQRAISELSARPLPIDADVEEDDGVTTPTRALDSRSRRRLSMELLLRRSPSMDGVTIGRLYVDGKPECHTVEDEVRPEKIQDQTAIPAGRYRVIITRSNRFLKMLPLLLDVPGFTGVRIHTGNTAEDTSGCILVGQRLLTPTMLGESRYALEHLQPQIANALAHDDEVWLTIVNAPGPTAALFA